MRIILGVDPGLVHTGWGVVTLSGNSMKHLASGRISPSPKLPFAQRLLALHHGLETVILAHRPTHAALEETFVNMNGQSTLKLGQARGAILLTLARSGLEVAEYAPRLVKKAIVGSGRADKDQIAMMVAQLLPGSAAGSADAADALALAICHAHHGLSPLAAHMAK